MNKCRERSSIKSVLVYVGHMGLYQDMTWKVMSQIASALKNSRYRAPRVYWPENNSASNSAGAAVSSLPTTCHCAARAWPLPDVAGGVVWAALDSRLVAGHIHVAAHL